MSFNNDFILLYLQLLGSFTAILLIIVVLGVISIWFSSSNASEFSYYTTIGRFVYSLTA